MNKIVFIFLLIAPIVGKTQTGLLMKPTPAATGGGGGVLSLYPGDIANLQWWIVADSTASVTYSGGHVSSITELVSGQAVSEALGDADNGSGAMLYPGGEIIYQAKNSGALPTIGSTYTIAGVMHNINGESKKSGQTAPAILNSSFVSVGIEPHRYDVFAGSDTLKFSTTRTTKEAFLMEVTGSTLSDVNVYVNNIELTPTNSPTTSLPSFSTLAAIYSSIFITNTDDFKLYEQLIIDGNLSSGDRESLFQYFYNKHSITP